MFFSLSIFNILFPHLLAAIIANRKGDISLLDLSLKIIFFDSLVSLKYFLLMFCGFMIMYLSVCLFLLILRAPTFFKFRKSLAVISSNTNSYPIVCCFFFFLQHLLTDTEIFKHILHVSQFLFHIYFSYFKIRSLYCLCVVFQMLCSDLSCCQCSPRHSMDY